MSTIIKDARELYLKTVTTDNGRSHIWRRDSGNYRDLTRIINECSTVEEVEFELAKTDMYAIRIHDAKTFDMMMDWHRDYLASVEYYTGELPTTPNGCKMLTYCLHIIKGAGWLRGKTVMELGGGNGQFMAAAKAFGVRTHIDIDIPESLYMAYVCTRNRFKGAKCLWVVNGEFNISDYDFIFCPVGCEQFLNKADIFVNTASMGEMSNEAIRYWMHFVQNQIDVKYFYGVNRFLNTVYPQDVQHGYSQSRKNENEASVLFDAKWEVLNWELEPEFARCPYEDTKIARYLEVMVRRISVADKLPHDYLDDVEMEDWWRYRKFDAVGTHRHNQFSLNLTASGTLFKLWNAMRVKPDVKTAEMMLVYLRNILRASAIFEEEYFYRDYIKMMVGAA